MRKLYLLFFLFFVFSNCSTINRHRQVKFEVTGTTSEVEIHWENETGGGYYLVSKLYFNDSLPWSKTFDAEKGDFVHLLAENLESFGSLTVTIYVDGEKFKSASCEGAYCQIAVWGSID